MTRYPGLKTPALKMVSSCIAASLACAVAPPALAQDPTVVAGVAYVPYRDLDLASRAGEKALTARVVAAAKRLCQPIGSATDIAGQACIRNAFYDARPQILSAIEQARNLSFADMSGVVHVRVR